jgi:hypothetical protein
VLSSQPPHDLGRINGADFAQILQNFQVALQTHESDINSLNCVGVHATLTMGKEKNHCYTTWNLRLGEQSPHPSSSVVLDVVPQAIQWLIQQQAELF